MFIWIARGEQEIKDIPSLARLVSDRHFGIGSDGLILICKSEIADFKMRMFNYDGTEAEMCGNGIRCVGKFVYEQGLTTKDVVTVETLAGIKLLKLFISNGKVTAVRVNMGEPILEPERIPVTGARELELSALDKKFSFSCISMGNPHAITKVEDVANFDVASYGKILEVDSHFPKRTNVEFIQIVDRKHIKMRVWERGAGETLACGTGACATAVACFLAGDTERKVEVELLGGTLEIEWDEESNLVYMTGPAVTVFQGEIDEQEALQD